MFPAARFEDQKVRENELRRSAEEARRVREARAVSGARHHAAPARRWFLPGIPRRRVRIERSLQNVSA